MSILIKLPEILRQCKEEYEEIIQSTYIERNLRIKEIFSNEEGPKGLLVQGDNKDLLMSLLSCQRSHEGLYKHDKDKIEDLMAGKIDLVYIDPPFFSKSDYSQEIRLSEGKEGKIQAIRQKAYEDTWENGLAEYLKMLTLRFFFIKEVLSPKGVLWVHLDWHAVHYIKIILDEIFGAEQFINEVVWQYKSGGVSKRYFARKHDTLLFYCKNKNYKFFPIKEKSYNRKFLPYRFKGVQEYQDELGWYTLVNMKDVWQIDMVGRTSGERTGYATQKPEALLERILESCTEKGDLCVDFFGGSGTLAAVAHRLGRNWISCDQGGLSILNTQKRLLSQGANICVAEIENKCEKVKKVEGGNKNLVKGWEKKINWSKKNQLQTNELQVRVRRRGRASGGEESIIVELLSYTLSGGLNLPIAEKDLWVIEKTLSEHSLQFIDYWSVMFNYDGKEYKPERYFTKGKNKNMIEDEWKKADIVGLDEIVNVAVRAIDIFGNNTFQIISAGKFEID